MLINNYDTSKLMIGGNTTQQVTYTNSTGSTVALASGRLMGRVSTSQKVLPHVSTATDGSEQPIGVLIEDQSVANGATVTLTICDGGEVAEGKVVLGGSDTLATTINGVSIRDLIARNSHIKLRPATELTGYDNQ